MNCNISVNANVQMFQFVMYIPMLLLGIIFNIMTLWVFCWKFRKWTETTIFMTNLVVSDTVLLLSLPIKIYSYRNPWNLGSGFCAFLECLYFVNMYVSIYIIVSISLDRYIAIKHPFKAKLFRSPVKAAIACGAIWTLVCFIGILLHVKFTIENTNNAICFLKKSQEPTDKSIIIAIELIGFIIPSFIVSFCSFQIIMTLCKNTTESQGNIAFSRSIRIVAANLTTFFICFMPFHVGLLLQFLVETSEEDCEKLKNVRIFINVSTCVANMNCCLDVIVYYFASIEVRNFLNLSNRKHNRNNVNVYALSVQNTKMHSSQATCSSL